MAETIIYVSVDMEADGPTPGTNSMLSLGADARLADGTKLGLFSENMHPLPGAAEDPRTMAWWAEHPMALAATLVGRQDPESVMILFETWLNLLRFRYKATIVFVAYPASFDYDYVLQYSRMFLGRDIFDGKIVDMRSMAMGILGVDYDQANKAHMPPAWDAMAELTHIAVEDATQQADLFFRMLAASRTKN